MSTRDVLFIIGMVRSGSSALTRVLSLCGCELPSSVLGSQKWNPTGNWDALDALKLNTEFMARHDTALGDPTLHLQDVPFDLRARQTFVEAIAKFLTECPSTRPLLIKDQSITELMEFWIEGSRLAGFTPKVLVPVRHPAQVLASLARTAAKAPPAELSGSMWLKYNLLAERCSRDVPRVFVEYSSLLKDWRIEMRRVAEALAINLKVETPSPVDDFLNRSLQHQRQQSEPVELFGHAWMSRLYSALSTAANDGPPPLHELDEIYEDFRLNERTFRIARDTFRSLMSPSQCRDALNQLSEWKSGTDF